MSNSDSEYAKQTAYQALKDIYFNCHDMEAAEMRDDATAKMEAALLAAIQRGAHQREKEIIDIVKDEQADWFKVGSREGTKVCRMILARIRGEEQ